MYISVVLSHCICGALLGQPQETSTMAEPPGEAAWILDALQH